MDKQKLLTIGYYRHYVVLNFPEAWKKVCIIHNVLYQAKEQIAQYCCKYQLFDYELWLHMHENSLISAADWENTKQGVDFWMKLSNEAEHFESNGCIPTFCI